MVSANGRNFCGSSFPASVISRSWVLTAGHCVLDYDDWYPDSTYGNYVAPSYFDVLTGTSSLTYQWQRNRVNIPGATSATLTLTNVRPVSSAAADAGT